MVSCMDDAIGRIVKSLKESRFPEDNTLVIFTSDNGGIPLLGSNRGLRAGKGTLYEGGLRVPTVMVWPGKLKADTEVDQPLHMVDLYPTLLRLAGASTDQPKSVDGRDAWPTITRGASSPHDSSCTTSRRFMAPSVWATGSWSKSLRPGRTARRTRRTERWELFEIETRRRKTT